MNIETLPLSGGNIGIERESLRTTADGHLAGTRHPEALGNVYTHPNITIDYGEALLELVTDPHQSPKAVYRQLLELHQFSAQNIGEERMWAASMPCRLPDNPEHIEIGYFGQSNGAKLKRLYRVGLSYRYGRTMQMIAGVHFNYSPPENLWAALAEQEGVEPTDAWRNERYMGMIRNIQRHGWLICHLFGAAPACDQSFQPAQNVLDRLHEQSFTWKNATTLRMSQLGYQNKVDFSVSFNHLNEYVRDLGAAVLTPAPVYEYLGLRGPAGSYRQISTNILQIANEYYSGARPKQVMKKGELPISALSARGIAYIELRLLDNNPYDPAGISLEQIHFLEGFMLWCLLKDSPAFTTADYNEANHNRLRTACLGLSEGFSLFKNGRSISAQDWADEILHEILPIAERLDQSSANIGYREAVQNQIRANSGETLRLPQRVQAEMAGQEFLPWAMALTAQHLETLKQPLPEDVQAELEAQSQQSLQEFAEIEAKAADEIPFDDYLANYFNPLHECLAKLTV
ncbi:glutamate--cysteine ligase [Neisseria yangbaofengii]|uniref:glutamate--cysteine ligase n=1 Tax=Neisseria yangbaofengii TaxID=2709396 RepID=UPI0013ED3FEE|nr:glutamate--cysteine ligase [Neisseria yangbaofengii]